MNPHEATIRRNRYLEALYRYGFMTLVYLIDEYEKDQNYEECEIIFSAIMQHNKYLNHNHPTKYNDEAKEYFKKAFAEFGLTGDVAVKNLLYYAEETKKMVNETMLTK